jgi:putative PIN family toxin of toxin-antitoxin system
MRRVVLDTNVLVGSAYNRRSASRQILDACQRQELAVYASAAILREYHHILPRAVRREEELSRLRTLLDHLICVEPESTPPVVPEDPADDKFLAVAVTAGADALVTNDRRVLDVDPHCGVRVVRPSRFIELFLT